MKNNWQTKKLGDVCDFEGGSQPPKSAFIHEPRKGYVRFLQIRDFGSDKHITYIPDSKKNRHCTENDILLGRYGASVGKILINKNGAYNVAIMKTLPKYDLLDKKYFYFYLISDEFQKRLSKVAARSAQAGFSKDDIYDFPLLTPPLPEQHRIVKILDEIFEKTAKAKENAKKNLQNAKELFESYLQSVFANPEKDWGRKVLGDFFEITSSKRVFKSEKKKEGVPFYRAREIVKLAKHGFVENELFISEKMYDEYARKYGIPKEGDIMVTGVGTLGICYVVKQKDKFYFKDGNIIWLKTKGNINSQFVEYFFNSPLFKKFVNSSSGATVGTFTIVKAKNSVINVPDLTKQEAIVTKLDALSIETKKLETISLKRIADFEELKKSVLKKAFNGEL